MIAANKAERLVGAAGEDDPPAAADRLFGREGRRLAFSFGIAVIVELALLLWFAHASWQAIRTEERPSSNPAPRPIELSIARPVPVVPIPTRLRWPAIQKLPVLPKLAAKPETIVLPPIHSAIQPPRIDWVRALQNYLHRKAAQITPFAMPVLPARPPSAGDLPTRIRLSSGGEIDRIGDSCYAVPARSPIASQGTNASVLPQATFAHAVPCSPGDSFDSEFLKRLQSRRSANRGSGR